jgi:hypothetical protein
MCGEAVHGRSGVRADGEYIEVTAGFTSASAAAGRFAADDSGQLSQVGHNGLNSSSGISDREPGSTGSRVINILQNGLFGFFAKALQLRNAAGFTGCF